MVMASFQPVLATSLAIYLSHKPVLSGHLQTSTTPSNNMHIHFRTIGALAAASTLVAGNAAAEVEYEIHAGYTSGYVWRGTDRGDDLAEFGLDAATTYNDINLAAGIWSGYHDASTDIFPGTAGDSVSSEINLYGEISKDFGFATLGMGYVYYWQVGNLGEDYQELYFSASRDFGFAEAYLMYFWNLEGVDGVYTDGYTELGLNRSWELNEVLTLKANTNFGYFMDESSFGSWVTRLGLDWGFRENAVLTPFVTLAVDLGDTRGVDDELVAGTMISVSF